MKLAKPFKKWLDAVAVELRPKLGDLATVTYKDGAFYGPGSYSAEHLRIKFKSPGEKENVYSVIDNYLDDNAGGFGLLGMKMQYSGTRTYTCLYFENR